MRYFKFQLLTILVCLASAMQAQTNVLRVDSVSYPAGKTLSLPILLENTSDITGVQFEISLPVELPTDSETGNPVINLSKKRAANHQYTCRNMGRQWRNQGGIEYYYNYRIIVFSDDNALLLDNTGTLLTLDLSLPVTLANGAKLPVYLQSKSVVLSDRQMNNVVSEQKDGLITIEEIPRPDLMPSDISFKKTQVTPGDTIELTWKVQNVGAIATEDGWSEQISLFTTDGRVVKLLETIFYDKTLAAKASVNRSAKIAVPSLLGLDGNSKVRVTVVPTEKTGEHPSVLDNNTQDSKAALNVTKVLTLELSKLKVSEGSRDRIQCKLSRSGRWYNIQDFTITGTNDSRLTLPAKVTIPLGQSGTVFYLNVNDNDVLDEDSVVSIEVSGYGYAPATARLVIEDNEYPPLTVKASKLLLTEGESFDLTISTTKAQASPLVVTLASEDNKRFQFPAQATIPKGQKSVTVNVTTVDDDMPHLEQSNTFTASAQNYTAGEAVVILQDNDMPVLSLTLTPNQVSEADGVTAVSAVLSRTGNTDNKISIRLSDDSQGGLYYSNSTLIMDKGVETIFFNLGPVDNSLQDGDRTYTLRAAIWVASCSCSAGGESAGSVEARLTVLDNDGAALSVSSQAGTVKEGGETVLTVKRNTTSDVSSPLTVKLSSNFDDDLEYQKTVIIPAGKVSADVSVKSKKNDVSGDSHTVIFTVQADGFASGTCFLIVTDQTLPDARITKMVASETEAMIGSPFTLSVTIVNDGSYPLAASTPVTFYQKGESKALGIMYTSAEIPVGGSETIVRKMTLSDKVADYVYYAVVNEQQTVNELIFSNNSSEEVTVKATSPFTAKVETDKKVYRQGDKVVISGSISGNKTANTEVDVYLINGGAREVETVVTDASGRFTMEWQLFDLQSGHFGVGACYKDDPTTEEMASFDVYGLKRADSKYITCDVTIGDPIQGVVDLVNPGTLTLTGVKAEMQEAPEGFNATFELPASIAGGKTVGMTYRLNPTIPTEGNEWQIIKVRITSKEGVSLNVTMHVYARLAQGNLVVEKQNLNTTMVKQTGRDYSFNLTNTGKGNTGKITLSLPDWMKPLSGATMPGLNQNDTATIVLRMTPTDDMQLNVPVTGRIGINCENGNGTYMNFSVTPVSNAIGTLVIDVCDEYTYYTEEKPHVSGAEVVIRNPITGALVTQGVTGSDGLFSVELNEGYYQVNVTADKHNAYQNNLLVDPDKVTTEVVNLSYQAVSVSWSVEETEVEDEYNITTTVKYETNVPTPVVEMVIPDKVEVTQLGVGESIIFYAVLTNKGLITAQQTVFSLPETAGAYKWEPLVECKDLTLAPQQSYVIPVKVTRMEEESSAESPRRAPSKNGCKTEPRVEYWWDCGKDWHWHQYSRTIQYEVCPSTGGSSGGGDAAPMGGLGNPNGPNILSYFGYDWTKHIDATNLCVPCLVNATIALADLGDCASLFIDGPIGCVWGFASTLLKNLHKYATNKEVSFWSDWFVPIGMSIGGCMPGMTGKVFGAIGCIMSLDDIIRGGCGAPDAPKQKKIAGKKKASTAPDFVTDYLEQTLCFKQYLEAYKAYANEFFGSERWTEICTTKELSDMFEGLNRAAQKNSPINADDVRSFKPQDISDAEFNQFIERMNNSDAYYLSNIQLTAFDNMIDIDKIETYLTAMEEAQTIAQSKGYQSVDDLFVDEFEKFKERLADGSNSTCATISLQINQTMTMTRQAFRGTLSVTNGNTEVPMRDVKLKLKVTNMQTGAMATAKEFEMHTESLKNFEGDLDMESGWLLGADETGTATILFIPSKYAAPEEAVDYSFGGTLSFVDPSSGLEVSRDLFPVTLTVKPSPELDLTYFMQRDIYGDDALTENVEPMVPAEFALVINNKGYGDATKVRMVTKQPEIVENKKGLLIDFEFVSSQLNGSEKTLAMGESIPTEFGTIPAHSQAYAQWWLQSSLLGHFVDYDIEATHVSSYGNENLSLLDQVTIHELVHGFTPKVNANANVRGFLVNDVVDADDMPDQVYFSDATQEELSIAVNAVATKKSDTEYLLTVTPMKAGWNYGSLLDPTVGKQKLVKVVRQSDNAEVNIDNVWQTDRTMRDGKEPIYENRLHFVGDMPLAGETFVLTFAPKPEIELAVESIEGAPAEGTLQTVQLTDLTVKFTKAIDASTFTTSDITLACQGKPLDASKISIVKVNDTTFKLKLNELTLQNGYYVLTVQTSEITDFEGFKGAVGKQATWVQFVNGKVNLVVKAQPAEGGTVTPQTGQFDYNKSVTMTATPATGYEFTGWKDGETTVSTDAQFSYMVLNDVTLTAAFSPKFFDVTINYDAAGGTVEGGATGHYQYGTQMTLTATAKDGYEFKNWKVNGKSKGKTATLSLQVDANVTVEAVFAELSTAILAGNVINDSDGTPIANATITLTNGNTVYSATTDEFGNYTVEVYDRSLTYTMMCEADGYMWSNPSDVWFTAPGSQNKNFALNRGASAVLSADGICTFSSTAALDFSNLSVEAYFVRELSQQRFVAEQVFTAAAGEGLILKGISGRRVDIPEASSARPIVNNMLTGTAYAPFTVGNDDVYIVTEGKGESFILADKGFVVPKGKAYCKYTTSSHLASVAIVWSESTLIELMKAAQESNENHYSLDGRIIRETDKGFHVVKGKKVYVK